MLNNRGKEPVINISPAPQRERCGISRVKIITAFDNCAEHCEIFKNSKISEQLRINAVNKYNPMIAILECKHIDICRSAIKALEHTKAGTDELGTEP